MPPALYLLPSAMSDGPVTDVLPAHVIDIARNVRYFVVENIRSARRFLKRLDPSIDISSLSFTVLDEHTPREAVAEMLAPLEAGQAVAVVSEAGCPAIADPGADLVAAAQARGLRVVPLVGPSSILLSLMGSGFNGQSFAFLGYLPVEAGRRSAAIRDIVRRVGRERQTQIFIETPYRNNRLLAELAAALPDDFLICVASDITGPGESIVTRRVSAWRRIAASGEAIARIPSIFLVFS